ncbi:MAG: aromatic ring-hydroxylating dioxygenase subunit alpha [Gammaproteobacteria bacterium]|nr:aromatic ring-hydroxylating dioxygenase subunit alpha [Gammaproteobacteria bacterium]
MLINNWYVAAAASEIRKDKPLRVRMLSCDFVLFRDDDDKAVCLSDVCCHRGAALGKGEMNGCNVVCPYHGWEFNGAGQCTLIPAMGPEFNVPKRARVDSYPTQEKYGWVWVFLGDLPENERPKIPDMFPEYEDPKGWHRGQGQLDALRGELAGHRPHAVRPQHVRFQEDAQAAELAPGGSRVGRQGEKAEAGSQAGPEGRRDGQDAVRRAPADAGGTGVQPGRVVPSHPAHLQGGHDADQFHGPDTRGSQAQSRHRLAGPQLPQGAAVRCRAPGGHPAGRGRGSFRRGGSQAGGHAGEDVR